MIAEYITERTKICRACSICDTEREVCNAKLYIKERLIYSENEEG